MNELIKSMQGNQRVGGVKGPMKDDKGRPTRKALALKKWNC
jgi:hypothetical protein